MFLKAQPALEQNNQQQQTHHVFMPKNTIVQALLQSWQSLFFLLDVIQAAENIK